MMVARSAPSSKEIIELLVRLKTQTPDYPADLLAARKTVFLKHAATLEIHGKGPGGESGGQGGSGGSGGSSGTALGSSTAAQGIVLQAAIGLGLVASMLIGAYFLRDQVSGHLEEDVVAIVESSPETLLPVTGASEAPTVGELTIPPSEVSATITVTPTVIESNTISEDEFDDPWMIDDLLDTIKDNPGLHLGQATGTPAAPGQGNPGNENQPDKPDKPEKPEKPDKAR